MADSIPDDARVGLAEEDYQFISDVAAGRRTLDEFVARYGSPARVPVVLLPPEGAAPHFYKRRPVNLCGDDRADDDDGPPNWADHPAWDVP